MGFSFAAMWAPVLVTAFEFVKQWGKECLLTKFVLICCQVVGWMSTACPQPFDILHLLGWCAYVLFFSCTRKAFEVTSVVFRIALVWGTQDLQNATSVCLPWGPTGLFPNGNKGKQAFEVTSCQPTMDCLGLLPAPALSWEIQFGPKVPKLGKAKK